MRITARVRKLSETGLYVGVSKKHFKVGDEVVINKVGEEELTEDRVRELIRASGGRPSSSVG